MKDKEVEKIIEKEGVRQDDVINLIASENFTSDDVKTALGSVFINKYAEGYPNARYYRGNKFSDEIENLCIKRALDLFGLSGEQWHVNTQALSGSVANLAVYTALVPYGSKIMGIELSHGGHLTHGHKVSATGSLWEQVPYYLNSETEMLDYDEIRKIAQQEKPKIIVAGYTAYSREVDWGEFRKIADEVGAYLFADISHIAGLVAGGAHMSPFPYADVVTFTTHKTLRGPRSALIFGKKELAAKIDKAVFPGLQGGPHLNQIAAVAVALKEAATDEFAEYAKAVVENTHALAEALKEKGWRIIADGTDTHLFLMDTWKDGEGIDGEEASERLEREGIIVNKNIIPFDTRKPLSPSGIRIGLAAFTTRGAKVSDMNELANKIDTILKK
jgi:glycine hydroxymethyltransferase